MHKSYFVYKTLTYVPIQELTFKKHTEKKNPGVENMIISPGLS